MSDEPVTDPSSSPADRCEERRPLATGPTEPARPDPLGVVLERTGNPQVDALLERLGDADSLPTPSHLEVYEDVHRGLRGTLTALDSRPGPPVPVPHGHRTTEDDRS